MAREDCPSPDDHVFGFNEGGDYRCLICGEPIQNDCDLPYDYEVQAKIYDALERGGAAMKRVAIVSFALGAVVGCAAYTATSVPQLQAMPAEHVEKPLLCWATHEPLPFEFAGALVIATNAVPLMAKLELHGRIIVLAEIAPGTTCVIGEEARV